MRIHPILSTVVAGLGLLLAPDPARADLHFGAGVGGALPWDQDGTAGVSFAAQVLGGGFADRLRLGAEFEFRDTEAEMFNIQDVDVRTYDLRLLVQVVPFPEHISPYIGIGAGLQLIHVDDDRAQISGNQVGTFGLAAGMIGLVGLQVPIGGNLTLFGEARSDLAIELTDEFRDALQPKDLGSFTGMAGVRLHF